MPYLLRQLKATWYTQEMAPQSMELSTPLMIMRGKKSSKVILWKWMNVAWSIDSICAGRRENIIQLLWYFVMWEQPLLSELVHVVAVMFKLGYFFSNWHCHSILACIELQIYWEKTHKHSKTIIIHAKDYQYSLWIMSKGKDIWEHHLSPMPYESDTKCHHHL